MPINPIRFNPIDAPPPPRPMPAVDFSGISSLGDSIGHYRDQQELSRIMAGAIDPRTGALDLQKAASALAITGRDPAHYLAALAREQSLKQAGAAQASLERYRTDLTQQHRDTLQQQRDIAEQGRTVIKEEDILDQLGEPTGRKRYYQVGPSGARELPQTVVPPVSPAPPVPSPAAAPVGPRTDVAPALGGPAVAAVNPEQGPPYQVAGEPVAGPIAAPVKAGAAPAATNVNPAVLEQLPAYAERIKTIANYQEALPEKNRTKWLNLIREYRSDYDPSQFQKQSSPPSSETQGRMGLAKGFLELVPEIRDRVLKDELNTASGRAAATFGQGRPGELANAISEGADALQRGLTGAGMNEHEAQKYAKRYEFKFYDTKETQLRNLNGLERALRFVTTEQGKGRGGEDLLKDFVSQFGKDVLPVKPVQNEAEANTLIGQARDALKRDPEKRDVILERLRGRGVRNPELMLGQ